MDRAELNRVLIAQLAELIDEYRELRSRCRDENLHEAEDLPQARFITRARAAIQRIAGPSSTYSVQVEETIKVSFLGARTGQVCGILESLHADMQAGYMDSVPELIHGELFGDFLEMAQHLMDEGYKDAAAVIAGSVLEGHLRQLCQKSGVETGIEVQGVPKPKKAERINADLAKASVYTKTDQKNITAWLDLRNKAAHGMYEEYEAGQVNLLISSVRDFFNRVPA